MSPNEISENFYFTDFEEEDFKEILNLWVDTDMGHPERKDSASTILRCNSFGGKLIVMKHHSNNEIVGNSWMTYDGRRIFLHHFGIKPSWQDKGLGKALGKESMKFIKSKGAQVKLEVHSNNGKAKKIYENLGFFSFEDYDIYMLRDVGASTSSDVGASTSSATESS